MDRLSSGCIWQAAGLSSCRGREPGFPDEAELDSVAHDPEHVVPASDLFAIPQFELHVVGIDLVILEKGLEAILHGLFDLRAGYPVIGGVSLIREAVIQEALRGTSVSNVPQAVRALAQGAVFLSEFHQEPAQLVVGGGRDAFEFNMDHMCQGWCGRPSIGLVV